MHFPWSLAPDARVIIVNAPGSFIAEDPNVDRVSIMGGGGSHDFLNHFGLLDGKILSSDGRVSVGYTEQSRQFGEWLENRLIRKPVNPLWPVPIKEWVCSSIIPVPGIIGKTGRSITNSLLEAALNHMRSSRNLKCRL